MAYNEILTNNIINNILENLDYVDLIAACQTDVNFSNVCNNDKLWKYIYMRDFPIRENYENPENVTWKEMYINKINILKNGIFNLINKFSCVDRKYLDFNIIGNDILKYFLDYIRSAKASSHFMDINDLDEDEDYYIESEDYYDNVVKEEFIYKPIIHIIRLDPESFTNKIKPILSGLDKNFLAEANDLLKRQYESYADKISPITKNYYGETAKTANFNILSDIELYRSDELREDTISIMRNFFVVDITY